MAVFIFIAILVLLVILFLWQLFNRMRVKRYGFGNLIVWGAKGSGKDVLMATMARLNRRKKKQFSNMPNAYGYGKTAEVTELTVSPNDYKNFLQGNISLIKKRGDFENSTYYFSDGGVYLPNYADTELKKQYPSLPIYYALSRHLYNQNIIINSQEFDRIWKVLRKQADSYIHMLSCRKLFGFLPILSLKGIYYDTEKSAQEGVLPLSGGFITSGRTGRANIKIYQAQHGTVQKFTLWIRTSKLKYDTRYFHEKLFGYKYNQKTIKVKKKLKKVGEKNEKKVS